MLQGKGMVCLNILSNTIILCHAFKIVLLRISNCIFGFMMSYITW